MNTDERMWPGMANLLDDNQTDPLQLLLSAVNERAIKDATEDVAVATEVFEVAVQAWRDGDIHESLADGLSRYIADESPYAKWGTFILDRDREWET